MVKVVYGDNLNRNEDITSATTTLKSFLDAHGFDYSNRGMNLDGSPLSAGDLNKTFADFGVSESCYLLAVAKVDNAGTTIVVVAVA